MDIDVACSPAYSVAYVHLLHGESVLVESGAMAYMSPGIAVSAGLGSGGIVGAGARKLAGGESMFFGRYTANIDGAWVACAPKFPGDVKAIALSAESLLIESGSLLAAEDGIDVDVRFSGVAPLLLREGATMLRAAGTGHLVVCAYGGIQTFTLGPGEHLIVDTGHLVGMSEGMSTKVGPLSSLATSAIVGEGIVGVLEGPGTVLVQTRSEQGFRDWILPSRGQNRR